MSLLKTLKAQLGLSVTPANNFTLDASADNGTMKLVRNSGQDIMNVAADGKVTFPQNPTSAGVGRSASAKGNATSVATTGTTVLTLDTVVFDPDSMISLSDDRIIVPVTGYYQVNALATVSVAIQASLFGAHILLNGVSQRFGGSAASGTNVFPAAMCSSLVYATAGQYFQVGCSQNASGARTVTGELDINLVRAG